MDKQTLSGRAMALTADIEKMERELFTAYALLYRYYCLHMGAKVTEAEFGQAMGMSRYRAQLFIHHHDQVHGEIDYASD